MFIGAMLILLAWFVEMPLWLSIMLTVCGSLKAVRSLIEFGIKLKQD